MLQRRFKIGYSRAARIVDYMELRGIVGPFDGSKPRQTLISRQQFMEMKL
jgi:S-DNA-T family DNA segregation ATPase FtsK/SpoIIIE